MTFDSFARQRTFQIVVSYLLTLLAERAIIDVMNTQLDYRVGQAVRTGAGYLAHIVTIDGNMLRVNYDDDGTDSGWMTVSSLRGCLRDYT